MAILGWNRDTKSGLIEPRLLYYRVLSVCFMSDAGRHCFDLYELLGFPAGRTIASRGYLKYWNYFSLHSRTEKPSIVQV